MPAVREEACDDGDACVVHELVASSSHGNHVHAPSWEVGRHRESGDHDGDGAGGEACGPVLQPS